MNDEKVALEQDADEGVRTNPDGTVTVKLRVPVVWGTQTIQKVTLRKPRTRDVRPIGAMDANGRPLRTSTDEGLRLLGRLTDHPDAFVDELDVEDMSTLLEVVHGFLPPSLLTGPLG